MPKRELKKRKKCIRELKLKLLPEREQKKLLPERSAFQSENQMKSSTISIPTTTTSSDHQSFMVPSDTGLKLPTDNSPLPTYTGLSTTLHTMPPLMDKMLPWIIKNSGYSSINLFTTSRSRVYANTENIISLADTYSNRKHPQSKDDS